MLAGGQPPCTKKAEPSLPFISTGSSHERLNDHILKNYPQLWEQYVRERRV